MSDVVDQELEQEEGFEDNSFEAYQREISESEARVAEKVKTLLSQIVPLTHFDGGSYWVEIVDEKTAWLAARLTRTAIAEYYYREMNHEEGEHVRRWFFLVSDKDGTPFSPACLCVVPNGVVARSRMTDACHTVGYENAQAYPDYAPHIDHLATITGLPIVPNWAGMPLPA